MKVQIIGDEVWADGHLVALLVEHQTPATVQDDFRHWLEGAAVIMPTIHDEKLDAADKVFARIEGAARGAFVKVEDVARNMGVKV